MCHFGVLLQARIVVECACTRNDKRERMPKASAQDASRVADLLSNTLPHHPIVRWGSSRPAAPLIAAADALERLEMPPAEVIQKECSVGALVVC